MRCRNKKKTRDLKNESERNKDSSIKIESKKGHWHGGIQVVCWGVFCMACVFSAWLGIEYHYQIYNILLVDSTLLAITIAITLSHAYNCVPNPNASYLWNLAEKRRSIWLHANHCWQTVHIWMTITPLYCTCIAIYLSGNNMSQEHILIYSILSLVISLGVYAISPLKRAAAYQKAYTLVVKALSDYELDSKNGEKNLSKAIKKGEKLIAGWEKRE